jgi:hypothetical protein
MGQATADLPDPLAASPNGQTSTDDLLAQLAGEEIERLLAETETAPEPQPRETLAAPAAVIAPASPTPNTVPAPVTAATAAPEAKPAAHGDDLEAIFMQLDERDNATAPAAPKGAIAAEVKPPAAAEEPSVAEALAAEMAEDEAQHARPASSHSSAKTIASHDDIDNAPAHGDAKSPSLLVSLLALVSSPLDAFPDHTRDLIGKIAILTMLNALCVLAYVVFFRR